LLAQDSWRTRNWLDKVRVWFKRPGWRPADVAARWPRPAFDIGRQERFEPPMTRAVAWFGAVQFLLLLNGVALFLWHADRMPPSQAAVWMVLLASGLWSVGAAMQGRLTIRRALLVEAAAIAVAAGVLGLTS
jgi:hypothetical protein